MPRRAFAFLCIVTSLALVGAAGGQTGSKKEAYLRVLVPQDDAKVLIDDKATKQKGADRLFETPPLEKARTFTYTVTATWWPNNYTEVVRTRTVEVKAGQETLLDLRKADPKHPDRFLIRFVPTPDEVVEAMCKLGKVGKDDIVYDLGCGDGRIVITAVTEFKAKRGVGVDIDKTLVEWSIDNAKKAKVADRVTFRKQDVLDIKDLGDATVVMLYMGEDVNLRLMPILKSTLKPGSRIVSHDFKMGTWKPEKTITVTDEDGEDHEIYLWTIK
jgi:uncharacterized protein (TIGR03000 family)